MVSIEQLAAWILEKLARLGCRGISLTVGTSSRDGRFRRGEEELRLRLERARRALFVLPSYPGDDVVWEALRTVAGGEKDGAGR